MHIFFIIYHPAVMFYVFSHTRPFFSKISVFLLFQTNFQSGPRIHFQNIFSQKIREMPELLMLFPGFLLLISVIGLY